MKKTMLMLGALLIMTGTNAQQLKETYYNFGVGNKKEVGYVDRDGFPTGVWKYFAENGSLDYSINWDTNFSKEYYPTGQLKETRHFNPDIGVRVGEWIRYYKNGNMEIKGIFNEKGEKNGSFESYYDDGSLDSIEVFKDGVKQE